MRGARLYRPGAVCYAVPMADPSGSHAKQPAAKGSHQVIASRDNRWLKRFRAALSGERDDNGFVGVEGIRLVEAALGSRLPVEALLVSESRAPRLSRIEALLPADLRVFRTSDKLFASVARTQGPQGIAALVQPQQAAIEDLLRGIALVAVLVGLQDPGNVGTIVRAAEAFGATGVATCAADGIGTADPFGPKALRASAGSALRLPIAHRVSPAFLLTQLRVSGVKVYAAVTPTSYPNLGSGSPNPPLRPWDAEWKKPAALLIGNEGVGLDGALVDAADARVYIPQSSGGTRAGIESLNAAMAASILLYEAMRQRTATIEG